MVLEILVFAKITYKNITVCGTVGQRTQNFKYILKKSVVEFYTGF